MVNVGESDTPQGTNGALCLAPVGFASRLDSQRYVQCDWLTWATWAEVPCGAAYKLACLHSNLAPEGFGMDGFLAIEALMFPPTTAIGLQHGSGLECEMASFALNLSLVERAIECGSLSSKPARDGWVPLLRVVDAAAFHDWARETKLPVVGPWPSRASLGFWSPDTDSSKVISDEGFLQWPEWNRLCEAINLVFSLNRGRYLRRFNDRHVSVIPAIDEIATQLRERGMELRPSELSVANQVLKPYGTPSGGKRATTA